MASTGVNMAVMKGRFDHLLRGMHFIDECSPLRHFLARLKLCRHEGTYITMLEYWKKEHADLPTYPLLFKAEE